MKTIAILIYIASLAVCFPLIFRLKWLEKPKSLNYGVFGTLILTPRDCYFLGTVLLLGAIGSTFLLLHSVEIGVLDRWFDRPGKSQVSVKYDSAKFRTQLYLQSASIPFVMALGTRILAYGRHLGRQT